MAANNAQCYVFKSLCIHFQSVFNSFHAQVSCFICAIGDVIRHTKLQCVLCAFLNKVDMFELMYLSIQRKSVGIPLVFLLRSTSRVTIAFGSLVLIWLKNRGGGRQKDGVNCRTKRVMELDSIRRGMKRATKGCFSDLLQ